MQEAEFLAEVSLFWFMKKRDLKRIAKLTKRLVFDTDEIIIREGERDGRLFVVVSGEAEAIRGLDTDHEKLLGTLTARSYFGEMAIIDDFVRSASVVAKTETVVLCLDQFNLREEIQRYPLLAVELLQTMSRRLRAVEKTMADALGAFLPICPGCQRVKQPDGSWQALEDYVADQGDEALERPVCESCRAAE